MKKYRCMSCGNVYRAYKQPIRNKKGLYRYDYVVPRFCPKCGSMMPRYMKYLSGFFKIYDLNPKLKDAKTLLIKSEFESACRECFIVLENEIKKASGIVNQHGSDLVSKAFSMKHEKTSNKIIVTQWPLIAINKLSNESEINEQEGIMHMLMGFFRGPRNIYQHNKVGLGFNMCFSILIEASFYLDVIVGKHSLLSKAHWIKTIGESPETIYHKMPRCIERMEYLCRCIKRGYYKPFGNLKGVLLNKRKAIRNNKRIDY